MLNSEITQPKLSIFDQNNHETMKCHVLKFSIFIQFLIKNEQLWLIICIFILNVQSKMNKFGGALAKFIIFI